MPVVNLPQDTRWGDLGKSLAQGIGGILSAISEAQTSKGVAEIMSDPSIAQDAKGVKALQKYGDRGYNVYKQMIDQQVKQAQISNLYSEVGKREIERKLDEAKLPTAGDQAAANLGQTTARTGLIGAQTGLTGAETAEKRALLPGQLEQQGATTDLTRARTNLTGEEATRARTLLPGEVQAQATQNALRSTQQEHVAAETGKIVPETELLNLQLQRYKKIMAEGGSMNTASLEKVLDDAQITNPADRAVARQAYASEIDPVKASEKFTDTIRQMRTSQRSAEIRSSTPVQTPEPQIKAASLASEAAYSAGRFREAFESGGYKEVGLFSGGPFKAFLEKYGVATGDLNVVQMHNAQVQQVADFAKNHGGFGGSWLVQLGKDVTPGIRESPMYSIVAMGEELGKLKTSLETQRAGMAPQQIKEPLDKAIREVDEQYRWAHSLRGYVVKGDPQDPRAAEKTVILFNGSQVNPKTFEPIVAADRNYGDSNKPLLGRDIVADAARRGKDPQKWLAYVREYYGIK